MVWMKKVENFIKFIIKKKIDWDNLATENLCKWNDQEVTEKL